MPQIRCPNCGLTINLESRKEIDIDLITNAVRSKPKTFSGLLRETRLPRKTLCLRLKELCGNGTLVKENGVYMLNGSYRRNNRFASVKKLSNIRFNPKMKSVLMVVLLVLGSPIVGYALAAFLAPGSQEPQEPVILGEFFAVIEIHNVKDLYAWQVVIAFNSSELEVLEIVSGGFVGDEFPAFVHDLDIKNGLLFLGGSMIGPVAGRDGDGVLARISFGYFVEEYAQPKIVPRGLFFETLLLDSQLNEIPIMESTLQLTLGQT